MFKPEGAEKLSVSNYMKFVEGANKFRILSQPVTGFEYWLDGDGNLVARGEMAGEGGKPVRVKQLIQVDKSLWTNMKAFAAMIVWNYSVSRIQILEIKQVGIMNQLDALDSNSDWGDIKGYDITITKKKTGEESKNVDYIVTPSPIKPLSEEVLKAYNETKVNIEALFTGEDPFDSKDLDLDDLVK